MITGTLNRTHDPQAAPDGFYAVPKSSLAQDQGNLCRQCDWREHCCTDAMDYHNPSHRCMPHEMRLISDGTLVQRVDQCSVVFKRAGGAA
jgi:hypothetical protein